MTLPPALRRAIEAEVAGVERTALRRAAAELSQRYRAGDSRLPLPSAAERAAYLLTRMPATYAATELACRELHRLDSKQTSSADATEGQSAQRIGGDQYLPIRTVLDLGSGPGTALWAIAEHLPPEALFNGVERNTEMISVARRLSSHAENQALRTTNWLQADLRSRPGLPTHDLVIVSYALGEIDDPGPLIDWAWNLAGMALVIVEPGTPKAFQTVLTARDRLIEKGATIAAPCPHHNVCPLAARNDWCHFRVRLERSAEHRRLKEADLGYEDEKFSYLIAARTIARQAEARIVRHPLKNPGHVRLTLCTPTGLETPAIGKSKRELYRRARKADWGDAWPAGS